MPSGFTSSVGRFGLVAAGGYALGPIGAAAGALLGSFLFGSSGPKIEGPRLGDLSVSSSTYGGVIPLGFGAPKVAGTIIWATDIVEEKTTRTVGGGLFGGGQDVTEYRYYANFAVAFGEGPAVDVPRLWAGEKLIYDRRNPLEATDGVTELGQAAQLVVGSTRYRYRVYLGSEDQEPDPLIAARVLEETGEADAVPAHRGMVYVVFERLPLEEWNNRIPPVTAEIAWSGERPNTVRNATFPLHGSYSFQRSQLAQDPERGFLYLGTTDGAGGMHRIRTDTMVEDLHVEEPNLDPKAVDHRGDIYATTISTVRKYDGSSYREIATRTGLNNPAVSLMSGYDALGQRYDFVLCMEFFGDRWVFLGNARAADPFSPLGTIWDGGRIGSGRKAAPIGGRRGLGDCEGWFVGGSLSNQPTMPITHVRLDIALVVNSLVLGLDAPDQGVEATELVVAAADFGTTGLRFDGEVAYDETNDRLLVVAVFDTIPSRLLSIDREQGVVWSVELATNERLPDDARFTGDKIYTISPATGATVRIRDASTGTLLLTQGPFGTADVGISGRALFDERSTTFYLTGTSAVHQVVANRTVPGTQPLGEIVQALCARAGLTAADLDVSELTDGVRGYALARQVSVRGALEMLAAAYLFDAVESEHQLKFIKRGREPVRVVPAADLVPVSQDGETFTETRAQEVDLPVRFTVNYQDLDRDGDIGSQYAKRVLAPNAAMRSQNEATFDVPLILTAEEAKGLALRQLHSAWLERTTYDWHTTWSHVDLEPGDVIQVPLENGTLLTLRILEAELGANLEVVWRTVLEEKSSYAAVPLTAGGLGYRRVSLIQGAVAKLLAMDVPLLEDGDDVGRRRTGYYWAAGAYTPPWSACLLYESSDDVLYVAADTVFAAATWGVARTALPAPSHPFQTDRVNTLDVAFAGGKPPASVTALEMLNRANRFALIRADGTAEIIHARDVTPNDDGSHTLSVLLRGRRGTEVFMNGHEAGELVLLLDDAVQRRLVALDKVDHTLYMRAVARGGALADAPTSALPFAGNDLRPYAPAHLTADQSVNQGVDIGLTWGRRTRVGGGLRDGTGTVPLAEDSEAYELEFLDPDGAVVRTVTTSTPSNTYTVAEQAADFPVTGVQVWQVSAQVGRGFMAELTFDNAPVYATAGEVIAEGQAGNPAADFEAGRLMAQLYAVPAGGDAVSLSAYVGGGSGTIRMALYADENGEPGALLGASADQAVSSSADGHWKEFVLPTPIPVALGQYWIAVHGDANLDSRDSDGADQDLARRILTRSFASGLPDPFGTANNYVTTRGMRMLIWTNPS